MAKVNSVKLGKFVTAPGRALFCTGNTASFYDSSKIEGTVVLDQDGRDAFQAFLDEHLPEALKTIGIKASALNDIFKEDTDKEGNATGNFRVKAKTKLDFSQKFYDGNGVEFKPEGAFTIPNGATIQMAVGVEVMKTATFTGIVLRLNGTKILAMPEYSTGLEGDTGAKGDFSYAADAPQAAPLEVDEGEISW